MAITLADFTKIWASTSPLTPYAFSDSNYQEGWNFIGGTPPARQMWDFIQKQNDEKMKYIVDNFLPLSGGAMTGYISRSVNDSFLQLNGGTAQANGSWLRLNGKDNTGVFQLRANDGVNDVGLVGNPDGTLKWNSKEVERIHAYSISASTGYIRYVSGLQIVWGYAGSASTSGQTVTFPVAFIDTNYTIITSANGYSIGSGQSDRTKTSAVIKSSSSSGAVVNYIVVGLWK